MMLYDVATENTTNQTLYQETKSDYQIEINPDLLYKLGEYVKATHGDIKFLNGIINNTLLELCNRIEQQHHTTSLSFDGREPRKDVLQKLQSIIEYLKQLQSYPSVNVRTIQNAIKTVLVNVDPRTEKKYLDCFRNFALKANGRPENYGIYDLTGFRDAVFVKLEEL